EKGRDIQHRLVSKLDDVLMDRAVVSGNARAREECDEDNGHDARRESHGRDVKSKVESRKSKVSIQTEGASHDERLLISECQVPDNPPACCRRADAWRVHETRIHQGAN